MFDTRKMHQKRRENLRRPSPSSPIASLAFFSLALAFMALSSCGSESGADGVGGMAGGTYTADKAAGAGSSSAGVGEKDQAGTGQDAVPAGKLTAGEWDDNLNFGLFSSYAAEKAQGGDLPQAPIAGRVLIKVVDKKGKPVSSARVVISADKKTLLDAPTGTDGRLLYLPAVDNAEQVSLTTVRVEPPPGIDGAPLEVSPPEGGVWKLALPVVAMPSTRADVVFVFDATGSMSDEMSWLQAEIGGIASWIKGKHKGVSLRLGLVVYRDVGDKYVSRSFDFEENIDTFLLNLGKQSAGGGGDYPEAMDKGLEAMNQLSWRGGNVARMAFLVADAPPHNHHMADALKQALVGRQQGIRLYGLAASGTGADAEYIMRTMSMLTLARYLFLTDDSGIGGSHAEPTIPCYHVLLLENLLRRVIDAELIGERYPPESKEIIKSVGNPKQGVCALKDGKSAYL